MQEQRIEARPPLRATVVGVVIALMLPFSIRFVLPSTIPEPARTALHELAMWAITASLLLLVVYWEGQRLRSVGLVRLRARSVLLGLGAALLLLGVVALYRSLQGLLNLPDTAAAGLQRIRDYPSWLRFLLVVRAAFAEEVLFRGYPIERLTTLTRSRVAGAVLPLVVFTAAHQFFWGTAHLPLVFAMAAILTALYVRTRDLSVNITAHFVVDFLGVFLAPMAPR